MFEQILKLTKMYLFWKRYGKEERDLLCSPRTTQKNFSFYDIRIFENCMFEQILKLTKCIYFGKDMEKKKGIYCARLAQLSTTFFFTKFAFLKIICLNKF